MVMPVVVPRYTIAELDRLPDDGNRYELLAGSLLVTPAPGPSHQFTLGRLTMQLAAFLAPTGSAIVLTPGVIRSGSDTQLEPDLLVVPAAGSDPASWQGVTDWWLAVEVSGRDSVIYDRDFKRDAYLHLGVREVWRVDLMERAVFVSRRGDPAESYHVDRLVWHPHEIPSPLIIDLDRIFPQRT